MRIPELKEWSSINKCSHTIYVFSVETPLKPSTGYGSCRDSAFSDGSTKLSLPFCHVKAITGSKSALLADVNHISESK